MRMEQATGSSNAVEIWLQELRSSSVTRGREWLQGALEEISALELRKMASARNVGRGADKKWLAIGELRARLLEVLAPPTQVGWKKVMTKVECLLHGSMLSDECCFVVAVCCILLGRRKLHWLPKWKNFA